MTPRANKGAAQGRPWAAGPNPVIGLAAQSAAGDFGPN